MLGFISGILAGIHICCYDKTEKVEDLDKHSDESWNGLCITCKNGSNGICQLKNLDRGQVGVNLMSKTVETCESYSLKRATDEFYTYLLETKRDDSHQAYMCKKCGGYISKEAHDFAFKTSGLNSLSHMPFQCPHCYAGVKKTISFEELDEDEYYMIFKGGN